MRFAHNKKRGFPVFAVLLFIIAAVLIVCFISALSKGSVSAQYDNLRSALSRAITYTYAVEGAYPESLDYIKSNYGLHYDESLFYVDYQPRGANIYPDVTIIETGAGE